MQNAQRCGAGQQLEDTYGDIVLGHSAKATPPHRRLGSINSRGSIRNKTYYLSATVV